jgi:NodT family efflux transporter outer membrane factor (OMF) lipoprotein
MSVRSLSLSRFSAVVSTGLTLLLAACTEVGPNYVRPAVPVPDAFKESAPANAGSGEAFAGTDAWWTLYGDPVLDGLVSEVEVNNQTLASAAAHVREAEALVRAAKGLESPTVGIGTLKSGKKNENDFGVGVSWELDLWGRIRRDVEAHRADAEASADDLRAATLSVRAQLVLNYFALREDDAVIALQQRTADADAQWQRMVANQFTQGLTSSADVAQALMRASASQMQLADLVSSRAQLEHAIAVLLGKPPADFSLAPAAGELRIPVIPEGVPAALLERRPDVRARERRMAAASARIGVRKAETYPSISLDAGIGVRRGPTATADVRAPLFTGGKLEAQVDAADAAYAATVADYRQTVLDAYREVEDALTQTHALEGVVSLQARAAAAAAESDRVTRNQYREGIADYTAVIDAASSALNAGRADLQLRRQRLDASVALIKALGGSWGDEPQVETRMPR